MRLGLVKQVGGIRALFANSHDWTVDELYCDGVRTTGVRHTFPASADHRDYGGAKGNGHIGVMTVRNAVDRYTPDGNAVVDIQFCQSDGNTPYDGPPQFAPITIGTLDVDGCGYAVLYATGSDVTIDQRSLQNTGLLRGHLPDTRPGYYDDFIQHGTLKVRADRFAPAYRGHATDTGEIIIMPDPVALRIGTYVHSADDGLLALPRSIAVNIAVTAAFTANRTIVLSGTDAVIGDRFNIDFVATGAFQARIRNLDATVGTTLLMMPARSFGRFIFDGTNWNLEDAGPLSP